MAMDDLTSKQELFSQSVASGNSLTDSYKEAYNVENMSDEAIYVEASRLKSNPKVALRIEELRKPAIEAIKYTILDHFNELDEIKLAAIMKEQYSVAGKMVENKGKLHQFYVDKVQTEDITPPVIKDDIDE